MIQQIERLHAKLGLDARRRCQLRERSVDRELPGPARIFRPELPNVAVGSVGGTKALESNQRSTVGVSTRPEPMRSGRYSWPGIAALVTVDRGSGSGRP